MHYYHKMSVSVQYILWAVVLQYVSCFDCHPAKVSVLLELADIFSSNIFISSNGRYCGGSRT
jgi:hypothetical protein